LSSEGCTTIFYYNGWNIPKSRTMIVCGKKSGTLYKTTRACQLIVSATNENVDIWHKVPGHMRFFKGKYYAI
jgi:hypothetical protein